MPEYRIVIVITNTRMSCVSAVFQPVTKRSLLNARLYPFLYLNSVASLADVLWLQDACDSTGLQR